MASSSSTTAIRRGAGSTAPTYQPGGGDRIRPWSHPKGRGPLEAADSRAVRLADELGDGLCSHLLHHPAAVDLDGLERGPQLRGDLLVEEPGGHALEDLPLARRQRREPPQDLGSLGALAAARPILLQRQADGLEKLLVLHRLQKKVHGAPLHRLDTAGNVAASREEEDRQVASALEKGPLQLKTVEPRHGDIQDDTPAGFRRETLQELGRRAEGPDLEALRAQ